MSRTAFITGITGQDGTYLTELLIGKGYVVHGLVRHSTDLSSSCLRQLDDSVAAPCRRLYLHRGDITETDVVRRLLKEVSPDEVYHLAGPGHVGQSFETPLETCELVAMATLRIFDVLRDLPTPPRTLYASSREIFGSSSTGPQDESTSLEPESPYGSAKAFVTQMARIYREAYGAFFCNAICFNHESPRRNECFVTRKVTLAAARIKAGVQKSLVLGCLDVSRDWGFAGDFVDGMWRMLQHDVPDDYVLATGKSHSLAELLQIAFQHAGLDWRDHVTTDRQFERPIETASVVGDASKASRVLGWRPALDFGTMIRNMVDADLRLVAKK